MKQEQNRGTKALTNVPVVQKFLDLSLNLLSLLRVSPVSSMVRQARSWHQVDLVLNHSQRWNARMQLRREDVHVLLQKVSNSRWQNNRHCLKKTKHVCTPEHSKPQEHPRFQQDSFTSQERRVVSVLLAAVFPSLPHPFA
jgi:hypothetical protein